MVNTIFETAIFLGVAFMLYVFVALEFEIRRMHKRKDLREQATHAPKDLPRVNVLIHRESHT